MHSHWKCKENENKEGKNKNKKESILMHLNLDKKCCYFPYCWPGSDYSCLNPQLGLKCSNSFFFSSHLSSCLLTGYNQEKWGESGTRDYYSAAVLFP